MMMYPIANKPIANYNNRLTLCDYRTAVSCLQTICHITTFTSLELATILFLVLVTSLVGYASSLPAIL